MLLFPYQVANIPRMRSKRPSVQHSSCSTIKALLMTCCYGYDMAVMIVACSLRRSQAQAVTSSESMPVFCRATMAGFSEAMRAITAICSSTYVCYRKHWSTLRQKLHIPALLRSPTCSRSRLETKVNISLYPCKHLFPFNHGS